SLLHGVDGGRRSVLHAARRARCRALHAAGHVGRRALHGTGRVGGHAVRLGTGVLRATHHLLLDAGHPALGRGHPTVHDAGRVDLLVEGVDVVAELAPGVLDLPPDDVRVTTGHVCDSCSAVSGAVVSWA